ncbi:hypothetical protein CONCODRAFT_7894, partial [Conidiobolus coronatus NRRL 28638]
MSMKSFSFKRYTPTKRPKKVKQLEATTENGSPIKKKRGRPVGWRKNHTQNEDATTTTTVENDYTLTQNIAETEDDSVSLQSPTKKKVKFFKLDSVEESTQDEITNNTTTSNNEDSNLVIISQPKKKAGRPKGSKNLKTLLDSVDELTQDEITINTTASNNEDSNLFTISEAKKRAGRPKGSKNLKTLEKEANQQIPPTIEVTQEVDLTPAVNKPGKGRGRPKKASISNILNPDPFDDSNESLNNEANEVDELI